MPMTYTLFESVKDFPYDGEIFQSGLVSLSMIFRMISDAKSL